MGRPWLGVQDEIDSDWSVADLVEYWVLCWRVRAVTGSRICPPLTGLGTSLSKHGCQGGPGPRPGGAGQGAES